MRTTGFLGIDVKAKAGETNEKKHQVSVLQWNKWAGMGSFEERFFERWHAEYSGARACLSCDVGFQSKRLRSGSAARGGRKRRVQVCFLDDF